MPANLSELQAQNPNIRSQMEEWQQLRANNGEDPMDWEAFRKHARGIGAPDPGDDAPSEFTQSTVRAASTSSASSGSSGGSNQSAQSSQASQSSQQYQPAQSQPAQQYQQAQNPAVAEALRIKADYEADKNTPTDKWLKARGMTKAQLDAALELAKNAA